MFHLALLLSFIGCAYAEVADFTDAADIDPLTVLIKEIKARMRDLSENIDKDIAALEAKRKLNGTITPADFPHPRPLFEGIFTPEQLENIEKSRTTLHKNNKLDHQAKTLVDRLLFLNEKGVDITGSAGGYHRSLGGGYLAPHQYEPTNVHWHSYKDEGRIMSNIDEFGRVIV